MTRHKELLLGGILIVLGFITLVYFKWPREMFVYREPIEILSQKSFAGGEITWQVNVCRKFDADFIARRYLINVESGTLYELPESSVISTLKVGECSIRKRTALLTDTVPPGEYGLMIRTTPEPSIYNFKTLEIRSKNTITILEGKIE